ncbi:MAG: hypothetical protein CK425_08905 [Parachlamydia sp.]|nr:MAG: hypothetical protein CK425_08905 [Parachlamydia sp.]
MKNRDASQIKKELAKKHACYVLITCDPPSSDGNMQVCMSYEGDATLAAYLLRGAQNFMEEQDEHMEGFSQNNLRIVE